MNHVDAHGFPGGRAPAPGGSEAGRPGSPAAAAGPSDDRSGTSGTSGTPVPGAPGGGAGRPSTGRPSADRPSTDSPSAGRPSAGRPSAGRPSVDRPSTDLRTELARARSALRPGPDTAAGPAGPEWPGPSWPLPRARRGELDLRGLLRLSLAASDRSGRLRPAASAGALHPVDTELVAGGGCSLPPGRYGYDPLRNRVHRLGRPPEGTPPGVTVELTVTARRTASHYGHRARPLLLLDTGHAAAALFLAARALGAAEPEVRLDGHAERPLATVRVRPPDPSAPAPDGPPPGPAGRATGSPLPEPVPTPGELLARRSDPPPLGGALADDALLAVLATAARAGGGDLRWCAAVGAPGAGLVEAGPDGTTLRRCATGEARPTLAAWAAGQAWIADAGAVLLARGCPADADAPHIRRTHLRAGFAVQLAHLTARRHGLAARPVGSWQRADLGAALGAPPGQDWIVHGLALGTRHADEENTT